MAEITRDQPRALSERDLDALEALRDLASDDGWSCSPRGKRLDRSGLSWDQWRRAVAVLLAAKLVDRSEGKRAAGEPDSYRLTVAGHEALTCGGRHTPPQVAATPPATPLGSCSSLQVLDSEGKNQPTSEGGMAVPPQGGVAPPQVTPPQVDALRLLERVAVAMERLNVTVTHSLSDEVHALMRALFARTVEAAIATSSRETSSSSEPPDCDCGPMVKRNGQHGRFWGCGEWTSSGGGCGAKPIAIHEEPQHRTSPSRSDADRRARDAARDAALADREAIMQAEAARESMSVKARAEAMRAQMKATASGRAAPERLSATVHGDALRLLGRKA